MKKLRILIAGFFCLFVSYASAQSIVGVVSTDTGDPITGASVVEKGFPKNGTLTDASGKFTLDLKGKSNTLIVTSVGYEKQEVKVSGGKSNAITLKTSDNSLDEVVVGYQSVKRLTTTSAISSVRGKDIENTPAISFDQMLQGRVAGLTVLSTSGEPGARNIVNVRGSTSLSEGGISSPLYVIDGMVFDVNDMPGTYGNSNPLSAINPNDIESIDVLKDASASAIYGARAANGVILVKTKRPSSGKAQYKISAYRGISDKPALKPVITGVKERQMKMELLKAGGNYTNIQRGELSLFLTDSLNPAFNNNVDWQGLFLQKAFLNNVDASISARTDKAAYRLSFNYYSEEGVMKGYGFNRIAPRLYLQLTPSKNVKVENNIALAFEKTQHGSGDGGRYPFSAWGFPSSFWQLSPNDLKSYTGRLSDNRDDDRATSLYGNTKVEVTIMPGLVASSTLDYRFGFNRRDWLYSAAVNQTGESQGINNNVNSRRWELTNLLTFYKNFGTDHSLSVLAGQGAEEQVNNYSYISGTGIPVDAIKTIVGVPSGPNLFANSSVEERSRLSWFGRVSYHYKGRYLLDFNYRRDASSRYSKNSQWGSFPAVSAGWIVSDEKFLEPINKVVSFFKIRGSYGITGVDPGSYYSQYQSLTNTANYYNSRLGLNYGDITTYNGSIVTYPNYNATAADKEITWEQSPQANLGFELGLLNDRIYITTDFYVRDSKRKIFDVAVPVTTGYTQRQDNFVSLRNSGVEVAVAASVFSPKAPFQWRINANIAYNQNYVTKLPSGGRDFKYGLPWMQRTLSIGQPLFSFQVWKVNGVYANTSDVPVDPLTGNRMRWGWATGPFFAAGDPNRQDMNGDYLIDDLDKISMGNPNPDVIGGFTNTFTYKRVSLDILCTFISGRSLWNGYLSDRLQDAGTDNPYRVWGGSAGPAMDFNGATFWQKPGDKATYPSLITNGVDKWHIGQSMFVEDASFFRMKRVSLSYALPEQVVKKIKMGQVRFFGMLDNVFVLSNATVPDPEAVEPNGYSSGNDYPIPKKYTIGIDISL